MEYPFGQNLSDRSFVTATIIYIARYDPREPGNSTKNTLPIICLWKAEYETTIKIRSDQMVFDCDIAIFQMIIGTYALSDTYVPKTLTVPVCDAPDQAWRDLLTGQEFHVDEGQLDLSALLPRRSAVLQMLGAR